MKIILNDLIPSKGFSAITIWPFIFIREDELSTKNREAIIRHERIHCRQQLDCLSAGLLLALILAQSGCGWWSFLALLLFYWWYAVEWVVRLAIYRNARTAYNNISFEIEAYYNKENVSYKGHFFSWVRYIKF